MLFDSSKKGYIRQTHTPTIIVLVCISNGKIVRYINIIGLDLQVNQMRGHLRFRDGSNPQEKDVIGKGE